MIFKTEKGYFDSKTLKQVSEPKKRKRRKNMNTAKKRVNQSKANKYRNMLSAKPTKEEKIIIEVLEYYEIPFTFQKAFYSEDKCFIVDFYIKANGQKIVIEIDGKSHEKRKYYDKLRTDWLKKHRNCKVIRFKNETVDNHLELVTDKILQYCL